MAWDQLLLSRQNRNKCRLAYVNDEMAPLVPALSLVLALAMVMTLAGGGICICCPLTQRTTGHGGLSALQLRRLALQDALSGLLRRQALFPVRKQHFERLLVVSLSRPENAVVFVCSVAVSLELVGRTAAVVAFSPAAHAEFTPFVALAKANNIGRMDGIEPSLVARVGAVQLSGHCLKSGGILPSRRKRLLKLGGHEGGFIGDYQLGMLGRGWRREGVQWTGL